MNPWTIRGIMPDITVFFVFCFFFTRKRACSAGILLHWQMTIMSSTATRWHMVRMKTSDIAAMASQILPPPQSKRCTGGCLMFLGKVETVLSPPKVQQIDPLMKLWGAKGIGCPQETVREKYCFVILSFWLGTKETLFDVFKTDVKKFYRTKSNRTYLSCK